MTEYNIPKWSEESRAFHDAICQARISASTSAADLLQHQLQHNKQKILALFDNPPKEPVHRSTLEAGKAYINGVAHKVTAEFTKEALFLSDQLDINEFMAASLLMAGMGEAARVSSNAIDTSVILYHTERGYLLASFDVMLRSAKDSSLSHEIQLVFRRFLAEIMEGQVPMDDRNDTTEPFMIKLIRTYSNLETMIHSISRSGSLENSQSNVVSGAGSGKLGDEVTAARLERLTDERVYLAQIIYHFTSLFWSDKNTVTALVTVLEKADLLDTTTPYLLLALLAAISLADHVGVPTGKKCKLLNNLPFLNNFHKRLIETLWTVPVLKSVVMLQWILFLVQAAQLYPTIKPQLPLSEEEVNELADGAISTRAFEFMNSYLLHFQQRNADIDLERGVLKDSVYDGKELSVDAVLVDRSDFTKFNADIRPEFQPFVIHELENMAVKFIEKMLGLLRKIQYREEDAEFSVGPYPTSRRNETSTLDDSKPQRGLEPFFSMLASIYRNRLNSGHRFWTREEGGIFSFVKWMTDIKMFETVRACYDFIASLATGDECSRLAFHFLELGSDRTGLRSSSLFSWGKLFGALQFYVPLLRDATDDTPRVIPEREEELIRHFLLLLRQVVQYSTEARTVLWRDPIYAVRDSLVELLSCRTSTDLRASLIEVLAAFCSPWGGGVEGIGRTISIQVWELLEDSNFLLPKRRIESADDRRPDAVVSRYLQRQEAGIFRELEIERRRRIYNETLAVVNLIGSAIHTQSRRESLISGFAPMPSTLPSMLGRDTRTPGGGPYIALVVDHIFLALEDQHYHYRGGKWQLADACLKVLENSLESFHLKPLIQLVASLPAEERSTILSRSLQGRNDSRQLTLPPEHLEKLLLLYLTHPGFEVIVRILSGTRVIKKIFQFVEQSGDILCGKSKGVYFTRCVVRCLRILRRTLEVQNAFCSVLIPYVKGVSNRQTTTEFKLGGFTFAPLPSLVPLGQLMLYHANVIAQIASLVNCGDEEEICYLSARVLHMLSTSMDTPMVSLETGHSGDRSAKGGYSVKLAKLLAVRSDAPSIIYDFSERLEIEYPEITTCDDYEYDINAIPFWRAEKVLSDKYNFDSDFMPHLTCSTRLEIVDLLLDNTKAGCPSPSLADFLLGYNVTSLLSNSFREARKNTLACFNSILKLLRQGEELADESEESMFVDAAVQSRPLTMTHPILAEKCHRLIYQLCANEMISSATMRYLRNEQDYFYYHFKAMTPRLENAVGPATSVLPGVMVCADGTRIETDFFALRAQLHQRAWLLKSIALELHVTTGMRQKRDALRLLELLYGHNLTLLRGTSAEAMDTDTHEGNPSVRSFEQPLIKMFEIVSSLEFVWEDSLAETKKIPLVFFEGLDVSRYEMQSDHGCTVYDIQSIYEALRSEHRRQEQEKRVTTEEEQLKLEEEMGHILQKLMAENHRREIAHGRAQCMHAWKHVVQVTLSECFDLFPYEAREKIVHGLLVMVLPKMLHTTSLDAEILHGLGEVVLALVSRLREDSKQLSADKKTTRTVDARLPVDKLLVLFRGLLACIQQDGMTVTVRGNMYTALVNFLRYVSERQPDGSDSPLALERRLVEMLSEHPDVLYMMCSDASDGLDVWKTTAYIALDALYVLARRTESPLILSYLQQKNFLRYSIETLRREDPALLNLLEEEQVPLTPLYIYEAKMTLFLRLALQPKGAQALSENRILEVLAQCQFMAARPELFPSHQGAAPLTERYEQLLVPTLKLIVALLYTMGHTADEILEKVEVWTKKQHEALMYILKDEHHRVTLASLTQLKLATSIMYHLSTRRGFFDNLSIRGLNHLHMAMLRLAAKPTEDYTSRVVPTTDEEKEWCMQTSTISGSTTVLVSKAEQLASAVHKNLAVYEQYAKRVRQEPDTNTLRPAWQ